MWVWEDVYVAACGMVFPCRAAGMRHERDCIECSRSDEPEPEPENDDDDGYDDA